MKNNFERLTASTSILARLLNLSVRRVQQLVQAGLLPLPGPEGHRLLDAVPAYLRLLQRPAQAGNLADARQKLIEVQTQIRQVELRQKSGELIRREAAEQFLFTSARASRDNLQNIPPRVSGVLAAERNQDKIFALLSKEIDLALEGLANGYFERDTVGRVPDAR